MFPFPRTHLSNGLGDRDAERGVAVQHGGADPEFGGLAIKVACHSPFSFARGLDAGAVDQQVQRAF